MTQSGHRAVAKKLTNAWVAKLLRAKGLKGSPEDLKELTRMMNEDLEREAQEAEKAAARETEQGRRSPHGAGL